MSKRGIQRIDDTRPQPFPEAPGAIVDRMRTTGTDEVKVLRWLLGEAWRRLRAGRRMERERALVFPEVSVIAKDIERMTRRLNELSTDRTETTNLFDTL